jgi:hypothetical protein
MVRSYPRNNFLDILRDPLLVTIMASIGLHAACGAFLLPIISKIPPEGKKIETGTVKVVELTPNEIQRIPQVPTPIPTPAPVTLPPVYQPSPPVAPKVPTATTIPATPVRTPTPKTPPKTPKVTKAPPKTPKVTKAQPTQPVAKSSGVDFNPETFTNLSPSPKPTKASGQSSKSSGKKGEPKPTPTPTPTPAIKLPQPSKKVTDKPLVIPTPSPATRASSDNGGGDGGQADGSSPGSSPTKTSPQPITSPSTTPTGSPNSSPGGSQPQPDSRNNSTFYGTLAQAANAKLQEYYAKYPKLKSIPLQPKKLAYPDKVPCSKVKQQPYIIFMPVFGKTPRNQDPNFGSTLADSEEATVFADAAAGNEALILLAKQIAVEQAQQADKNRAEVDKDRPVAYSIRVEFDPATCKN